MQAHISSKTTITTTDPNVFDKLTDALTFPNPKYEEAVKFGRWTGNIERTIRLYEFNTDTQQGHYSIIVPRGAVNDIAFDEVIDQRTEYPAAIHLNADIVLRDYQERAVESAVMAGGGLVVSPTGSGKTVMALALAERLGQRTLILVKSKELMKQWVTEIFQLTGCVAGIIGGGKWSEGEQFTVATVQTLIKHGEPLDYGLVIIDEAHNVPAEQAFNVINRQAAKFRFGLSATPQRRDGLEFMITAALGPVCAEVLESDLTGAVLPVRVEAVNVPFFGNPDSWQAFLTILENDHQRNELLTRKTIEQSMLCGVVVVTATVSHAETLADLMQQSGADPVLVHGGLNAKARTEAMSRADKAKILIGTIQLLGEGLNFPHLGAVVFAAPVSASIDREDPAATRLMQAIGRARRPYPGRTFAAVLDIVDKCGFGVAAFQKRQKIYQKNNFSVIPGFND